MYWNLPFRSIGNMDIVLADKNVQLLIVYTAHKENLQKCHQ